MSVITSGHTAHAAAPDWSNQRHCERIEQAGSSEVSPAGLTASITASMMPQRLPDHCWQAPLTQVLAKRKRFSGDRPRWAIWTNSSLISIRPLVKATRPSDMTMPTRIAPSSHRALGHRIVSESISLWLVSGLLKFVDAQVGNVELLPPQFPQVDAQPFLINEAHTEIAFRKV